MFALREKEKSVLVLRAALLHQRNTDPANNGVNVVDKALFDSDIDVLKRKQIFLSDAECQPYSSQAGLVEVLLVQNLSNDAVNKLNNLCTEASTLANKAADAADTGDELNNEVIVSLSGVVGELYWSSSAWDAIKDIECFFPSLEQGSIERTLGVIKPGGDGEIRDYVMNSLWATGLYVVAERKEVLGKEQVAELLYPLDTASPHYEESMTYLTSGPSTLLILEGAGAVARWRLLCGSEDDMNSSTTIRGNFSDSEVRNVVHCSESVEAAKREINCVFNKGLEIERTLCILKPNMARNIQGVKTRFAQAGFEVIKAQPLEINEVRAEDFARLSESNQAKVHKLTTELTGGTCVAVVLARAGAVNVLKQLVGPDRAETCRLMNPTGFLRGVFGHGFYVSSSLKNATTEIGFLFPELGRPISGKFSDETVVDYLCRKTTLATTTLPEIGGKMLLEETLQQFTKQACLQLLRNRKATSGEALNFLADYLDKNNPNTPKPMASDVGNSGEGKMVQGGRQDVTVGTALTGETFTIEQPRPASGGNAQVRTAYKVVEVNVRDEAGGAKAEKTSLSDFEYPPTVVFVGGPAGVGKRKVCEQIAREFNYVHINLKDLIDAEAVAGSKRGLQIQQARQDGKAIPSEVVLYLLKNAMLDSESDSNRYLLDEFPTSLEAAIAFETDVAEASCVLLFGNADQKTAEFYRNTGRLRQVAQNPDYATVISPMFRSNFTYVVSSEGMQVAQALSLSDDLQQTHAVINAREIYQSFVKENSKTSEGKKVAAALASNKLDLEASIVCPLIIEAVESKQREGFSNFVFVEFPKTRKQAEFFEYRLKGNSKAVVLNYPQKEVLTLAARIGNSQQSAENDNAILQGSEIKALLASMKSVSYVSMQGTASSSSISAQSGSAESEQAALHASTYRKLKEELRPRCVLVLGPPGCHQQGFSQKWASEKLGGSNKAVSVNVEDVIESELKRGTVLGAIINNMTAIGQVVPLREVIINRLLKSLYSYGCEKLVIQCFPAGVEDVSLVGEEFRIDEVFSFVPQDGSARSHFHDAYCSSRGAADSSLVFNMNTDSFYDVHATLAKQESVRSIVVNKDSNVDKLVTAASEACRDRYLLFTGLAHSGVVECVLENLAVKYSNVVAVTPEILVAFCIEKGHKVSSVGDVNALPGDDLKTILADFMAHTKSTAVNAGNQILARSPVFALVNVPANSEQYTSIVGQFGAPSNAYYFKATSEYCVARGQEKNAALEEPAEFDAEAITAELEERLPLLNGIVDLANTNESATPVYSVFEVNENAGPDSFYASTHDAFKKCCYLVVAPSGGDLPGCVASQLANKLAADNMSVDAADLLLNADRVLPAAVKKSFAAELACITRSNGAVKPSPALWAELLRATIDANPQNSQFILTNYINASTVSDYPTHRDLLDTLAAVCEIKKIVYCKFRKDGEPLVEDLARLSGPEDLGVLFQAGDFMTQAYGDEKVHAVVPQGEGDALSYAARVVDGI